MSKCKRVYLIISYQIDLLADLHKLTCNTSKLYINVCISCRSIK